MADRTAIVLRAVDASPSTIVLDALPVAPVASQRLTLRPVSGDTTITLQAVRANEIGGIVAAVEVADVAAAAGVVLVAGSLASADDLDTASISGGVVSSSVAGDLAATDSPDTIAAAGSAAAPSTTPIFRRYGSAARPRRSVHAGDIQSRQGGQSITAAGKFIPPAYDEELLLLLAA